MALARRRRRSTSAWRSPVWASASLCVDLDPQGNASTGFGVPHQSGTASIYDVLIAGRAIDQVVVGSPEVAGLDVLPATIDLAGAEIELVSVVARESRLKRALASVADNYDFIMIDCPPSLGLLTVNAMVAADEVLIPIQCEYYALEGLGQLLSNIELVRAHLNPTLHVGRILLTMYDARTRLADDVIAQVRGHFGALVLPTVIPRNVRVSEAPGFGQSVLTYDPSSRGAKAYAKAAEELLGASMEASNPPLPASPPPGPAPVASVPVATPVTAPAAVAEPEAEQLPTPASVGWPASTTHALLVGARAEDAVAPTSGEPAPVGWPAPSGGSPTDIG